MTTFRTVQVDALELACRFVSREAAKHDSAIRWDVSEARGDICIDATLGDQHTRGWIPCEAFKRDIAVAKDLVEVEVEIIIAKLAPPPPRIDDVRMTDAQREFASWPPAKQAGLNIAAYRSSPRIKDKP